MKLNLGCGFLKKVGFVNVDISPDCEPDVVKNLEEFPWPWEDNSVNEVLMIHVLEHLGRTTESYMGIIKELYRVCQDGAMIKITVPHPRHVVFLNDPTHVRPITAEGLAMFSKRINNEWIEKGCHDTPLGVYYDVDFEVVDLQKRLDPYWIEKQKKDGFPMTEFNVIEGIYNNVVIEMDITMKAIKS